MKPIALFFHGLFVLGFPPQPLPMAASIISEQMAELCRSGLLEACDEFHVGINGGAESYGHVEASIPKKAQVTYHGLASRGECPTIVMLENWVKNHPGWNVLYFHSKGASWLPGSQNDPAFSTGWRNGMMADLVTNWRQCVTDLDCFDIVCSHWIWNAGSDWVWNGSDWVWNGKHKSDTQWNDSCRVQHIPAGNFLWITSNFAAKLPSIFMRQRIKIDGIAALSSRYEAEVYWGNGPTPNVKSFRPNGGGGVL